MWMTALHLPQRLIKASKNTRDLISSRTGVVNFGHANILCIELEKPVSTLTNSKRRQRDVRNQCSKMGWIIDKIGVCIMASRHVYHRNQLVFFEIFPFIRLCKREESLIPEAKFWWLFRMTQGLRKASNPFECIIETIACSRLRGRHCIMEHNHIRDIEWDNDVGIKEPPNPPRP